MRLFEAIIIQHCFGMGRVDTIDRTSESAKPNIRPNIRPLRLFDYVAPANSADDYRAPGDKELKSTENYPGPSKQLHTFSYLTWC